MAMDGGSRQALAAARERVEAIADAATLERVGSELFAVVGQLDAQPVLRRSLTDQARDGGVRAELATQLLQGRVSSETVDVVASAVRNSWSRPRDLVNGLEHLGVLAEVIAAGRTSRLDEVEDELFRFGRVVESNPSLRDAVTSRHTPVERRQELVGGLLEGKAAAVTIRLVRQAVSTSGRRRFADALEAFAGVAADWQNRLVATVRTAVPLTQDEHERLARTLARQYGHEVRINLIIDPEVVGGVRVDIGDDVVEGTIAGRLAGARRSIAG